MKTLTTLALLGCLSGFSLAEDKLAFDEPLSEEEVEEIRRQEALDLEFYLGQGIGYLKSGEYERAAEAFNSAIVIRPDDAEAIRGLLAVEKALRERRRMAREAAGDQP